MHDLFQTILLLSLLGSGLGLILLCLKPLLVRWVPPRWQTWLWAAVLLAMVLPVYQLVPTPPPDLTLPTIQPQAEAESPAVSPQTDQEETAHPLSFSAITPVYAGSTRVFKFERESFL